MPLVLFVFLCALQKAQTVHTLLPDRRPSNQKVPYKISHKGSCLITLSTKKLRLAKLQLATYLTTPTIYLGEWKEKSLYTPSL